MIYQLKSTKSTKSANLTDTIPNINTSEVCPKNDADKNVLKVYHLKQDHVWH